MTTSGSHSAIADFRRAKSRTSPWIEWMHSPTRRLLEETWLGRRFEGISGYMGAHRIKPQREPAALETGMPVTKTLRYCQKERFSMSGLTPRSLELSSGGPGERAQR